MTIKLSSAKIKKFQEEILEWYKKNQRDLPWRHPSLKLRNGKGRDPYAVLVSEVMSQQTQIRRVVPKYLEWMKRFPTIESLAEAPTSEVLRYWSGLGYNRRAIYLKEAAKQLLQKVPKETKETKETKVVWPTTEEELRKLPGVGEYTARAILCFAFGKEMAVIDTNIRKVILTLVKLEDGKWKLDSENGRWKLENAVAQSTLNNPPSTFATLTEEDIKQIAQQLLPKGKAYIWNQALMDYASAVLKEHKIPVPKQSHFKTSNRFYRGQVLRLLLQNKNQTIRLLFQTIENNGITKEKLEEIIKGMEKDGLVVREGKNWRLP